MSAMFRAWRSMLINSESFSKMRCCVLPIEYWVQNNLEEVLASLHGIKVVLSMVSSLSKHLPPHAKDMLSPPERTVAVSPAVDDPGEAGEDSKEAGPEGEPTQTVLGLSKKDPERKRCVLPSCL